MAEERRRPGFCRPASIKLREADRLELGATLRELDKAGDVGPPSVLKVGVGGGLLDTETGEMRPGVTEVDEVVVDRVWSEELKSSVYVFLPFHPSPQYYMLILF